MKIVYQAVSVEFGEYYVENFQGVQPYTVTYGSVFLPEERKYFTLPELKEIVREMEKMNGNSK